MRNAEEACHANYLTARVWYTEMLVCCSEGWLCWIWSFLLSSYASSCLKTASTKNAHLQEWKGGHDCCKLDLPYLSSCHIAPSLCFRNVFAWKHAVTNCWTCKRFLKHWAFTYKYNTCWNIKDGAEGYPKFSVHFFSTIAHVSALGVLWQSEVPDA